MSAPDPIPTNVEGAVPIFEGARPDPAIPVAGDLLEETNPDRATGRHPDIVATFYCIVGGNDWYFRAKAPADAVGGRVSQLREKNIGRAVSYPNRDTGLPWEAWLETPDGPRIARTKKDWLALTRERLEYSGLAVKFPAHEGAAVFNRPCLARATLARFMRESGIRTVAETDDNYFAQVKHNLFLRRQGHQEELRTAHAKALASMDAIVFSTRWLRDRYRRELRARFGRRLPDLFVARNCISRQDWPERDPGDGRIRVGFMGSTSHVWDVNLAYAAFHAAKQHENVETVMVGYNPGNPDPDIPDVVTVDGEEFRIRSAKSRMFIDKWAAVIDRHIPWVGSLDYRRAALPLDIGLCPLRTDEFTLGKSDVKAVEYTVAGAAVVCWNMPVYNTAGWRHGENCLMAGSWREMAEATVRLIRDDGLRAELVTAAQDMVRNERNEAVMRDEWTAAIQG